MEQFRHRSGPTECLRWLQQRTLHVVGIGNWAITGVLGKCSNRVYIHRPSDKSVTEKYFYFSAKTYVVGTQNTCLN